MEYRKEEALTPFSDARRTASEIAVRSTSQVDFAYQPIVSTKTLTVHGFEALSRTDKTPFANFIDLLEALDNREDLYAVEMANLGRTIDKFAKFERAGSVRLFCNLDSRLYEGECISSSLIRDMTQTRALPPSALCLEISERYQLRNWTNLIELSKALSEQGMQTALDDFGIGMSGLHLLLRVEPNYVKIDQSFITDIANSQRQQALVSKLCGLAHSLGFQTVAEGIESERDFRTARDLGCDFAQGFHIARPTVELNQLKLDYSSAMSSIQRPEIQENVRLFLDETAPLVNSQSLLAVDAFFASNPEMPMAPVVDAQQKFLGAVYEEDLRAFKTSEFGLALLANKASPPRLDRLVKRCPIADATSNIESILNSYVGMNATSGIVLSREARYAGYLSNHALMRLALDREVTIARESNPLSLLPGNQAISRTVSDLLRTTGGASLAYFDFDNFKAFNDTYGFSAGDRALLIFSDILRKYERDDDIFVGHIGGDDFFIKVRKPDQVALQLIEKILTKFAEDVSCLYSPADRARGGISAADRFGNKRFFPLLRASASVLHLPTCRTHLTARDMDLKLTMGKKAAKRGKTGVCISKLEEPWDGCCAKIA